MCEPTTLAITSMAIAGASAGLGAFSQYRAGQVQGALSRQNAKISDRAAVDAADRGAAEAGKANMQGSEVIGKARAAAGASGVDVQSRSVLGVVGTTRLMARWNADTIRDNAVREGLGYAAQADNFRAQGAMAESAGAYNAAGSLLTGAGSVASIGYGSGLFPKFGKG